MFKVDVNKISRICFAGQWLDVNDATIDEPEFTCENGIMLTLNEPWITFFDAEGRDFYLPLKHVSAIQLG